MGNDQKMRTVYAPFDGSSIGDVPLAGEADVDAVLQKATQLHSTGNGPSLSERINILRRASELINERREEIASQAAREGGKPLLDSLVEIDRAVDGLEVCIETLRADQGSVVPMRLNQSSQGRIAFTQSFPIGPVVAVSAFNHPFNLVTHQAAPAIAVGNPVIVKPASATPLSAMTFKSIMEEAGLPEGWIEIVNTSNSDVATKLVTDPRVRFFSFIGSGGVGWRLRSQLAPGVRCALEHGGVAPVIVAPDADVDKAVTALTKGGFYHAGQVCVSVQRIFAHENVYDKLVEGISSNAKNLVVGDPTSAETEVGPIISHREADRIGQWVDEAVSGGAKLAAGGVRLSDSTYSPTVLLNPPADCNVSRQEVFGPVVAIFKVSSVEQGVSLANDIEFAFQSSIFTSDIDQAFFAFKRLNASAVMVNDHTAFRTDWMPFAGLGPSGLGVGGMPHTIHEMQYEKMMVVNSPALATL